MLPFKKEHLWFKIKHSNSSVFSKKLPSLHYFIFPSVIALCFPLWAAVINIWIYYPLHSASTKDLYSFFGSELVLVVNNFLYLVSCSGSRNYQHMYTCIIIFACTHAHMHANAIMACLYAYRKYLLLCGCVCVR